MLHSVSYGFGDNFEDNIAQAYGSKIFRGNRFVAFGDENNQSLVNRLR